MEPRGSTEILHADVLRFIAWLLPMDSRRCMRRVCRRWNTILSPVVVPAPPPPKPSRGVNLPFVCDFCLAKQSATVFHEARSSWADFACWPFHPYGEVRLCAGCFVYARREAHPHCMFHLPTRKYAKRRAILLQLHTLRLEEMKLLMSDLERQVQVLAQAHECTWSAPDEEDEPLDLVRDGAWEA